MRHRAASKWRWIQEYVGAPRRLLDLGAGEGYVGKVAAQETGAEVVLADIVDLNRTELPLVLYDGRHVPLSDGAFDVTLLVFVLHHSSDPEQVIQEAKRVTRGQIIVLESVVENQWDRRWLPFADTLANRIRSGGRMEEGVLHFGTPEGWHRLFESVGLEVRAEERKGRWLHKQHLFVLE
jgi:ubiquinone/menaquinone biosynthesis C-methylase UbiE